MYNINPNLASLISARICHDLANPIGAISNGMELMELSGAARTPEFELTADSVHNANAKLNFFRIAFGPTTAGDLPPPEITRTLDEVFNSTRCQVDWQISDSIDRNDAKRLFLLLQCLSSALPRGGVITVSRNANRTTLAASGDKVQCDGSLWDGLSTNTPIIDLKASAVHFELARIECEIADQPIALECTEQQATITL
jgi:histidine phosphotransferase ChpT